MTTRRRARRILPIQRRRGRRRVRRVRRVRPRRIRSRRGCHVADFPVTRAGAILAVSDFGTSLRFYRDQLGLTEVALYDAPPYATLTAAGARISLAEQGHPSPDRPGVAMAAPSDPARANVVLVLEVPDADVARKALEARGLR